AIWGRSNPGAASLGLPCGFPDPGRGSGSSRKSRWNADFSRLLYTSKSSIVQSIAFAYPPGGEPHPETDPLNFADPLRAVTVKGAADMERQVFEAPGIAAIVLRSGFLFGPRPCSGAAARQPALHVRAGVHPGTP